MLKISPSLLACDFARLAAEIADVEAGGADSLHVDVMDGHFVPNITIGPVITKAIARVAKLPLDAHLMIEEPLKYAEPFARSGVSTIIFHPKTVASPADAVAAMKKLGVRVGIAISPDTGIETVSSLFPLVDYVLVMTVYPGFGGQEFIESTLEHVAKARAAFKGDIGVDGGIATATAPRAVAAGANVLVAGTFVFSARDRRAAIAALRKAGGQAA